MVSKSIVIIPTYNEKENIKDIILAILSLSYPFDILIIDADGSNLKRVSEKMKGWKKNLTPR